MLLLHFEIVLNNVYFFFGTNMSMYFIIYKKGSGCKKRDLKQCKIMHLPKHCVCFLMSCTINKPPNCPVSQFLEVFLTGAVSCEEALPPMAGAALYPSQDDPSHVHPHFTFTGQLSQHQAVHVSMKEETSFVPDMLLE